MFELQVRLLYSIKLQKIGSAIETKYKGKLQGI